MLIRLVVRLISLVPSLVSRIWSIRLMEGLGMFSSSAVREKLPVSTIRTKTCMLAKKSMNAERKLSGGLTAFWLAGLEIAAHRKWVNTYPKGVFFGATNAAAAEAT
ncbi:hypothetical protein WT13_32155 [Burkholderia anthina]|nr:hypothetical protein WT13_32155 [Burkholderia anthina]